MHGVLEKSFYSVFFCLLGKLKFMRKIEEITTNIEHMNRVEESNERET